MVQQSCILAFVPVYIIKQTFIGNIVSFPLQIFLVDIISLKSCVTDRSKKFVKIRVLLFEITH